MKAQRLTIVFIIFMHSVVQAEDWPPSSRATHRGNTAANYEIAPPSPLRSGTSTRNADFNHSSTDSREVRQAQFSADDFAIQGAAAAASQAQYTPPVGATTSKNDDEFDLAFGETRDAETTITNTPGLNGTSPTQHNDPYPARNRAYVPPSDTLPVRSQRSDTLTTPPPASVPTSTPPLYAETTDRNLPMNGRGTGSPNSRATVTPPTYPGRRELDRRPAATYPTIGDRRPSTQMDPNNYRREGYRQAQLRQRPQGGETQVTVPPPSYELSNPFESAANTAVGAVESGARNVSEAVRKGADSIAAEGRRRGNTYFLTLLALFASVGLNLYLGWIAWDTYNRYQDLVADMRYTNPRRSSSDLESSYETPLAEPAAY